jgi:hypothetical protein
MYFGSFEHGKIIEAFTRCVPGTYVRDYRDNGGYITICKNYKDIKWRDQTTTAKVERQVPAITLVNLPRGNVTAGTRYRGLKLERPGWRIEFRRAMRHLSRDQMKAITKFLGAGEIFSGERER